jgi:hypothetical protein
MNNAAFRGRMTASDEEAAKSLAAFLKEIGSSASLDMAERVWQRGDQGRVCLGGKVVYSLDYLVAGQ